MPELRVPVALDHSGELLRPDHAPRDSDYRCPECNGRIILRAGTRVVRHFAHYKPDAACKLTGEGAHHLAAKHLIANAASRGAPPTVFHRCRDCGGDHEPLPLRALITGAELEHAVETRNGTVRFDVALFGRQGLLFGVEVRATNPVSVEKRGILFDARLRWIEVAVSQVLEDDGRILRPLAGGGLKVWRRCRKCKRFRDAARKEEVRRRECRALVTGLFGEPRFPEGMGFQELGARVPIADTKRIFELCGVSANGIEATSDLTRGSRLHFMSWWWRT